MNPSSRTQNLWDRWRESVWSFVWGSNLARLRPAHAACIHTLRVVHMVWREVAEGQLTLRAMSLVYTTLLSLVPLLAVSFSVLKGFGVHDQLEPTLLRVLAPLGEKAAELSERIVSFVENVKVGLLGSLGLGILLYTVISLVQKVERSFNYTWRVRHDRSLGHRFSHYLSVLLVGPVLVFSAMGLTASLASAAITQKLLAVQPLGWVVENVSTMVPTVLIIAAFTFVYVFLPNTQVRWRPALVGGLVAGVLWVLAGFGFTHFVVSSTGTTAIYSSFAILMIFMVWVYLAWLILLVGSSVAFYTQHPEYLGLLVHELGVSNRMRERVCVQSAFAIAQRHYYGLRPITTTELAQRLRVPYDPVADALEALARAKIVVPAGESADTYVPARDLALIGVDELIGVVRATNESNYLNQERLRTDAAVEEVFTRLEAAHEQVLGGLTLRELVAANPPEDQGSFEHDEIGAPAESVNSEVE